MTLKYSWMGFHGNALNQPQAVKMVVVGGVVQMRGQRRKADGVNIRRAVTEMLAEVFHK